MALPRKARYAIAGSIGIVLAIVVGIVYFAPEGSRHVDQELGDPGALSRLGGGTFSGADRFHSVEGAVTLYDGPDGPFLRFENYEATDGPDVFFFVTERDDGGYEAGRVTKVLVPGGADGGQATLRGNFNVPLPDGLDVAAIAGIVVWCEDFSVEFGRAVVN